MIKKILYYLNPRTFFQKNEAENKNASHKTMQGINRLSIYMFLFCVILIILKYLR